MATQRSRALLTVAALTTALLGSALPAYAAGGGSISGRVVDASNQPVVGACVRAERGSFVHSTAHTAADGGFQLTDIPAGVELLVLDICDTTSSIAPQWYRNALRYDDASGLEVTDGGSISGIVVTAAAAAAISGRVTDTHGPVVGACVTASPDDTSNTWAMDPRTVRTDSDGRYRLDRLPAAPFHVSATGCGAAIPLTYAPGTSDPANARTVTPTPGGETTGVDIAIQTPARLSGSVRDGNGSGLSGQCVTLLTPGPAYRGIAETLTGSTGTWSLSELLPGDYRLQVSDCATGLHLTQWYDGTAWRGSGTATFHLEPGADRAVPALSAPAAGVIAGTSKDDTGAPIPNTCFWALPADSTGGALFEGAVKTTSPGQYRLGGLPAGRWVVTTGECRDGTYTQAWLGGDDRRETARVFDVTPGQQITADAVLPRAAFLAGTIRDELGTPARGCVVVDGYGRATSGADGTYLSQPLYPRSYAVSFTGPCQVFPADGSDARTVTLAPGQTASGVDGTIPLGIGLSGHVRAPDGNPVSACVEVTGSRGGQPYYSRANAAGAWRIDGLPADSYAILFRICTSVGPSLAPTYYPGVPELTDATRIPLGTAAVTGIDTVMLRGYQVSGTLTMPDGRPYKNGCISLLRLSDQRFVQAVGGVSDAEGHYTVGALGPAVYRVMAQACSQGTDPGAPAPTWFASAGRVESGQALTVATADLTAIDIRLLPGGTRRGRLLDTAGSPIQGCAYLGSGDQHWGRLVSAGADGRWVMYGVGDTDSGTSVLSDCGRGDYVDVKARGVSSRGGQDVDLGDTVLKRAGSISGTATDETGAPVAELCVSTDIESTTRTAADGTYKLKGLLPGPQTVEFRDCGGKHLVVPEYWHDKVLASEADVVTVREAQDTAGISPVLLTVRVPSVPRDVRFAPTSNGTNVSWVEPADDGHAPVTSYVVRAASTGIALVTVDGSRRSAVLTGAASTAAFTVEAVNRKGAGARSAPATPGTAPGSTTPPPGSTPAAPTTKLTLTGPSPLRAGSTTTLRATLMSSSAAAIAGQPVRLMALPAGTTRAVAAGRGTTNSAGAVTFTVLPHHTTRYIAFFDGDGTNGPASKAFDLRVVPRVSAHAQASTVRRGSAAVVDATSRGLPTRQRAVLQVRRRDGSWANVATGYLTSSGAVRLSWRPAARGTSVFQVVVPMANGISAAKSLTFSVRVT